MSTKITNPGTFASAGDPQFANGSFEFYRIGTFERRFAKTNPEATKDAPFENALDADSHPVQELWVDSIDDLDIVIRDASREEVIRGPLIDHLDKLTVVQSGAAASSAEVTASIAGSLNQYTQANVPTV